VAVIVIAATAAWMVVIAKTRQASADTVDCARAKCVALTFDDGPTPFTDRLLRILRDDDAKATFFLIGNKVARDPASARRIADAGMEIGGHTWEHPNMTAIPEADIPSQLSKATQAIAAATGKTPTLYRPAGGLSDDAVRAAAGRQGLAEILWDVIPFDWINDANTAATRYMLMTQIKPGSVVLLHDTYSSTVDLVYQFLPVLRANGYHLVTVSHLLGARAPGSSYGGRQNGPPVNDIIDIPASRIPALPATPSPKPATQPADHRHSQPKPGRPTIASEHAPRVPLGGPTTYRETDIPDGIRAFESVTATEVPGAGRLRALVVDDRRPVVGSLAEFLHREQFVVHVSSTGHDTLRSALDHDPDLVVLDLAIPGFDAVEVCRELRSVTNAYLVVLSARQRILDAIGEPVAADEFIVDPISPRELVTRLRAIMRRPDQTCPAPTSAPQVDPLAPTSTSLGKLRIDLAHRRAVLGGTLLPLTRIEFEILATLASRPGSVFTRKQLVSAVWGEPHSVCPQSVGIHIGNLRRKLGDDSAAPRHVITVRGSGYRLATR